MDKDKSIIAKFAETMKGLADSAAEALKAEEPSQIGERAVGAMPLAAAGLVSDPLLPPVAVRPVRRKKRAAKIARSGTRKVKGSRTPGRPCRGQSQQGPRAGQRPVNPERRSKRAALRRSAKTRTRKTGSGKTGTHKTGTHKTGTTGRRSAKRPTKKGQRGAGNRG